MKISVLTVVYNEEQILPFMLEGVIPSSDEIIIVDGGPQGPSTDNTPNIVREFILSYSHKMRYLQGTFVRSDIPVWDEGDARKNTLDATDADYLVILDGDEVFDPTTFASIVDFIRRYPGYAIRVPCISFFPDTTSVDTVIHEDAGLTLATRVIGYPRYSDSHYLAGWRSYTLSPD